MRAELVRLRKDKRLTQEKVARSLEWSPSKLIRIEGGHSSPDKVDLDALLTQYGAVSAGERLHALNRSARERGWWDVYRDDFDPEYLNFVGYEMAARSVRQTAAVIPDLLQTSEYARVLASDLANIGKISSVVALRLQRQQELTQHPDPPYRHFVLDEAVIRRHIGIRTDPAIMPGQLRSIADWTESDDRLTVQIVPFEVGEHAGLQGAFTLMEFGESLPAVLGLDPGRGPIVLEQDPGQVAEYRRDFESLSHRALTADASIRLIRAAAEDMSG